MSRINLKEITLNRVLSAISRRVSDLPDALAWQISTKNNQVNKSRLVALKDKHNGQRCFIMANGPSLATMDLSPLANEITFGLNRIYLLFDRLEFRPTYHVCVNELLLEQFTSEIAVLEMPKFLNWNRRSLFKHKNDTTHFVRLSLGLQDKFVKDFSEPLCSGGTVTYVALQLAYIMGFTEVILIGLDHSFADKGTPNRVETRTSEVDANHFHPNYFPKGTRWQLPDLRRSELAYELARKAFDEDGRKVIDATLNGRCPVFEKADYQSLF
jgi:hypothetical protein